MVFNWIAGSTQVNSPKHKQGSIFRSLSVLDGATLLYYVNYMANICINEPFLVLVHVNCHDFNIFSSHVGRSGIVVDHCVYCSMTEIRQETHWIVNTTGWFNLPSWKHTTRSLFARKRGMVPQGTQHYTSLRGLLTVK